MFFDSDDPQKPSVAGSQYMHMAQRPAASAGYGIQAASTPMQGLPTTVYASAMPQQQQYQQLPASSQSFAGPAAQSATEQLTPPAQLLAQRVAAAAVGGTRPPGTSQSPADAQRFAAMFQQRMQQSQQQTQGQQHGTQMGLVASAGGSTHGGSGSDPAAGMQPRPAAAAPFAGLTPHSQAQWHSNSGVLPGNNSSGGASGSTPPQANMQMLMYQHYQQGNAELDPSVLQPYATVGGSAGGSGTPFAWLLPRACHL